MKVLDPGLDLDEFFDRVRRSNERALLLDYDGTLSPFRAERDRAFPHPGVPEALESLLAGGRTRIVIVSGRTIDDLLPLLGTGRVPEIWGAHGWQRLMPDGSRRDAEPGEEAARLLDAARRWCDRMGRRDRCERKPASVALHWRGLDPASVDEMRRKIKEEEERLTGGGALDLREFDGGYELRAPGRDKGFAVDTILSEMGEGAAAAYLGDDLTDEDAFRAIRGRGLAVLVRSKPRATAARLWLKPPREVLWFLDRWKAESQIPNPKSQ